MRVIPLTQGVIALVDDEDYDRLNQHNWCASKHGNRWVAVRVLSRQARKQTMILMHRVILNAPDDMEVDHVHHEPLENGIIDNRRENLRLCTHQQNGFNRRKFARASSQYKGVRWHKRDKRWEARVKIDGALKYLGCFSSEEEAARAYDRAAREAFGEFARVNFS